MVYYEAPTCKGDLSAVFVKVETSLMEILFFISEAHASKNLGHHKTVLCHICDLLNCYEVIKKISWVNTLYHGESISARSFIKSSGTAGELEKVVHSIVRATVRCIISL